jgi:acyl carrier protein
MLGRLQSLLRDATGSSSLVISSGSHLHRELGIDSITLVTFAFMCEREFSVDLVSEGEAVVAVETIEDLIKLIRQQGGK